MVDLIASASRASEKLPAMRIASISNRSLPPPAAGAPYSSRNFSGRATRIHVVGICSAKPAPPRVPGALRPRRIVSIACTAGAAGGGSVTARWRGGDEVDAAGGVGATGGVTRSAASAAFSGMAGSTAKLAIIRPRIASKRLASASG